MVAFKIAHYLSQANIFVRVRVCMAVQVVHMEYFNTTAPDGLNFEIEAFLWDYIM